MTIRIGLLGASRIARGAVIAPAMENPDFVVGAVAARNPDRARAYAAEHGIPIVVDDYEALIARDDLDLIYNALPPAGHKRWTIAALEAGKHVLCEKPFARNAGEAKDMVAAADASGQKLIEAFHYRLHNVMRAAVALAREGALGRLMFAQALFNGPIPRTPGELRWSAEQGGGALMDLGCYPVHALRSVIGAEPEIAEATCQFDDGVDAATKASLAFPGGVTARLETSMITEDFAANLTVIGERGSLEIRNFVAPQIGCQFVTTLDGERHEHGVDGPSTYAAQLTYVADVLAGRTPQITGGADAIANMATIDAIYRAAGRPEA
ncbi:MAG TPA: Gfo/Idh/MocA family oxidoreductase [Caulobacteraceae bacterium]|jgi:predicted dehydrogenase